MSESCGLYVEPVAPGIGVELVIHWNVTVGLAPVGRPRMLEASKVALRLPNTVPWPVTIGLAPLAR